MGKKIFLLVLIGFVLYSYFVTNYEGHKISKHNDYPIWIDMMDQENVNVDEAREAFDNYWEYHTHHKGDKSKKFEQWYAINSRRLDQYGHVISTVQVRDELQRIRLNAGVEQQGMWFNYGPINVGPRNNGDKRDGGRVKDIEFHPIDPNTYFVSCFKSGLFKTSNGGKTWIPLTDQLPQQVYISKVVPSNPGIMYIGTDAGILMSSDGGLNWEPTGLSNRKTKALLIKPDDENVIVAGNESGIFRSTDAGNSFVLVQAANKVEELRIHPEDHNIIYAGTNGPTSQFFRSTDGGISWVERTSDFGTGAFIKIAVTPAQPDYVYLINSRDHLDDDSFEGVYRSTDTGITFIKQSGGLPCITGYNSTTGGISRGQPNYNLFIVADPVDANIVYAGGVKSWKSIDGGVHWTQSFDNVTSLGFGLHLDQLTWAYSPSNNRLFAVNDGGVYFLNEDNKFQPITDGLPIAEAWECTQSQTNPSHVAGGTFHCGIKLFRNGDWYSPWGGDEATVLFDHTDDNFAYHFKYEKISRSVDGGFSFQRINPSTADRGYYTGTGVIDRSDVNTLYVGLFEVERTQNARTTSANSVSWTKISSFGGNKRIEKIEQSYADHNILYVSREGNKFYRSDDVRDLSPTFKDLTSKLPLNGKVTDIATHPTDANVVYILLGSQIYKSFDKGESWTNISGEGLPGVALLEMVYDNSSDEGIYLGTDIGVYYKDATMNDWIDYSEGLPVIRVSGMDIYYGENREKNFLTISTDGRGFWRSELYGVETQLPEVDFKSDTTSIFSEGKVRFTNLSSEVPVGTYLWTFEGGSPATSIDKNPIITYKEVGIYRVTLEYTTNAGIATKSKDNYITVVSLPPPAADFSVSKQSVFKGSFVSFVDNSLNQPATWEWTFEGGDPTSSMDQNPIIKYNDIGTYKVVLKVTNSAGSDIKEALDFIKVTANSGSGSLQGHYNFDENLFDASSYARDLNVVGSFVPSYIVDKDSNPASAYQSQGESGQYLIGSYKGVGSNKERSVTAWFKTNNAGSRKTIVSWGQNMTGKMFNVMIHNGKVRIEGGTCNVQSFKKGLDNNSWHHVAVTYDSSDGDKLKDIKIYIDGVFDANEPDSGASYQSEIVSINTDTTLNDLRIGSSEYNGNYFWQGSIDDLRIFSRALSSDEIFVLYANGTTGLEEENLIDNNTKAYPNPFLDFITIETSIVIKKIATYNASGNLVMSKVSDIKNGQFSINMKNEASGLYFVVLETNRERHIVKIIKR